jgi:hypothetical protein
MTVENQWKIDSRTILYSLRGESSIVIYNSWKRDRKEKDLILNQIDKKSWVYDVKPC